MEGTLLAPAAAAPEAADRLFEELYRDTRDDLFAYVAGLLRDRSAAEDVTALAFERAFRKRSRFNPERGSHRAWLFGIARNAALDELRRRGRQAELGFEPADESAPDPDEHVEAAMRRATVREAMEKLSARERELIALKYFAGLGNAEIASVVGISESNAGTRVHRVVEKLRKECS